MALSLEKAGADFIVICTNTMHKVVSGIKKYTKLPILHIAEMTAIELKKAGIKNWFTWNKIYYATRFL